MPVRLAQNWFLRVRSTKYLPKYPIRSNDRNPPHVRCPLPSHSVRRSTPRDNPFRPWSRSAAETRRCRQPPSPCTRSTSPGHGYRSISTPSSARRRRAAHMDVLNISTASQPRRMSASTCAGTDSDSVRSANARGKMRTSPARAFLPRQKWRRHARPTGGSSHTRARRSR